MTRKKWNRLKRQRPELFKGLVFTAGEEWFGCSWEQIAKRCQIAGYSKSEVVGILTARKLVES